MLEPAAASAAAPIDAVVLWVDGDDAAHRARLDAYLATLGRARPPAAAPTRFHSLGEVDYCVSALLRFAPFVRCVHVVTDRQRPTLFDAAAAWPAAQRDRLRLVDHREIFVGFEDCLPSFNSRSIESLIHRIPGLAEQFVYLNDDFLLVRPLQREDWFVDGRPLLRGRWPTPPALRWPRRLRRALSEWSGRPPRDRAPSHLDAQARAATAAGWQDRFFAQAHHPHPTRRSTLERWFADHPERLRANVEPRLRSDRQLLPLSLAVHLELAQGGAPRSDDARLVYVKAASYSAARVRRCLARAETDTRVLYLCLQSLDGAPAALQHEVLDWCERLIGRPAAA
ncbi:MAG: Stealth CR1 domain-containing protein [Rubrivivax sp.]